MRNKEITVLEKEIHINKDKYFSLTDIAKYKNPDKKGNIRDYAEVSQLVCLSNLENLNAYFIE